MMGRGVASALLLESESSALPPVSVEEAWLVASGETSSGLAVDGGDPAGESASRDSSGCCFSSSTETDEEKAAGPGVVWLAPAAAFKAESDATAGASLAVGAGLAAAAEEEGPKGFFRWSIGCCGCCCCTRAAEALLVASQEDPSDPRL